MRISARITISFALILYLLAPPPQKAIFFGQNVTATAGSAPVFIQAGQCNTGGNSCTITLTTGAGDSLYVGEGSSFGATNSISDCVGTSCAGGTDTFVASNATHSLSTANTVGNGWFVASLIGGSTVITCTSTSSAYNVVCNAIEMTAAMVDCLAEADTSSNATQTAGACGPTTQANELVVGVFLSSDGGLASPTAGAGYSIPTGGAQDGTTGGVPYGAVLELTTVSSTGTYTPTIGVGSTYSSIGFTASFK